MADTLGSAAEAEPDFGYTPQEPGLWREPATLALIAFPLALLSLFNTHLLSGTTYTAFFSSGSLISNDSASSPAYGSLTTGAFLSAAIALLPVLLALHGRRRLIADDPRWAAAVLHAAVVLGALSVVLHVIIGVLTLAKGSNPYFSVLG